METLMQNLKKIGHKQKYSKGGIIFSQGDAADSFCYVLSGEVRAYKMDEQTREKEVGRFLPGVFFGEVIVFATDRYPVFAEAVKETTLLFFSRDRVRNQIKNDPSLAEAFLKLLATKCISLNAQIEMLTLKTVRERLIQYIFKYCGKDSIHCTKNEDSTCTVVLPVNKTQLARSIGTISETLSRNLKTLQEDGLIEVQNKKIIIKDCGGLKKEL